MIEGAERKERKPFAKAEPRAPRPAAGDAKASPQRTPKALPEQNPAQGGIPEAAKARQRGNAAFPRRPYP
ncbi:hypothetical protein Bwad002_19210 [Bilophila wadsworthia]